LSLAYRLKDSDEYDPSTSQKFAKKMPVGRLSTPITKAKLKDFMYQMLPENKTLGYNCQHWVGAVLENLATTGNITKKNCDDGQYGMSDAVLEAKDEPEPERVLIKDVATARYSGGIRAPGDTPDGI
jgi:hypothetical protein